MLSISYIAGSGSQYYIEGKTVLGDYYLEEAGHTYWGGGAKTALNLDNGLIKSQDFDRLMQGYTVGGHRIGNPNKDGGWNHNPGRDLTFSDPKSVSILMQGPLRTQLLKIRRVAVQKTMDYGEQHFARTRIKGQIVGNQKTIWAAVNEDTSRANDPNSHTHVVLFNMLQGEDGKFRALHNQRYFDNQILLGQIYRSELAKGVKELGFNIESTGKHGQWEIEDIDEDIRKGFSKRREAILAKIDPENNTAKAREKVCLITRPSKQAVLRDTLIDAWNQELAAKGTSLEALSIPKKLRHQQSPHRVERGVKVSMDIIAETNAHTSKYDLYREVMTRSNGHLTIDEILTEVQNQVEKGSLTLSLDGEYLARSIDLRREKQITQELQKGHLNSKPFVTKRQYVEAINDTELKDDQKEAIKLFLLSNSTYVKIQGDAGSGKTTALKTSIPLIKNAGYKVIGLSTTSESTDELEKAQIFDKVMTLQKYLMIPEGDKKTVLVIDESSMIGRDQMLSLLRYTNSKKMPRVLFQGDENQMSGVLAGQPFKDMEESGVRSVIMNEIIRQKNTRHREAIANLARKNIEAAFEKLGPEIHEISKEKLLEQAVTAWVATKNDKTPVIVQTNKQKNAVNAAIKEERLLGRSSAKSLTLKTWQTIYKTTPEKSLVSSYQDATHIRFNRDYKRFKISKGDIYKIGEIDESKSELNLLSKGKSRRFNPAKYKMGNGAIELYKQEERTLDEGDRIRFTRGGHFQPVNKNQLATVSAIGERDITFTLENKKTLTLSLRDKAIRHLDHAWASTTHAFQGKTVDHAIVVMPSHMSPLTSLDSLYTGASRHRLSVTLITDDAQKLQTSIERNLKLDQLDANIIWPEVDEPAELEPETQDLGIFNSYEGQDPEHEIEWLPEQKQELEQEIDYSEGIGM